MPGGARFRARFARTRPKQGQKGSGKVPKGRTGKVLLLLAVLLLGLLAYAWINGGREPLHVISQPVAVPEKAE